MKLDKLKNKKGVTIRIFKIALLIIIMSVLFLSCEETIVEFPTPTPEPDPHTFVEYQGIHTNGASDWEFFTIGDDSFLAVANQFGNSTNDTVSRIYKAVY